MCGRKFFKAAQVPRMGVEAASSIADISGSRRAPTWTRERASRREESMQRTGSRQLKYRAVGRATADDPDAQRIPAPAGRRWPRQVWSAAASDRWAMRVWAAVLIDAITALRGVHPEGRAGSKGAAYNADRRARLRLQARRWVRSRDRGWIGAFEVVCDSLEIDTDTVRQDLLSIGAEK